MIAALGPHAGYIAVSYGIAALVLGGLAVWALMADARASRDVAALETARREREGR